MAKTKTRYVCQNCEYISPRYLGRCPNCGSWNSLVEEIEKKESSTKAQPRVSISGTTVKPKLIDDVSTVETPRFKTNLEELNRVLGGGIVPGSLVLIGGDPGIGKSTLLLQVSGQLSTLGKKVLYVSGEESATQIKLRADRLGVHGTELYLYPETDMDSIRKNIELLKPDFVVIDSVQTMQEPEMTAAVGSVSQIREVTGDLMQIAKTNGITVFVVGHVTKGGAIAGPKILEHMVDTVLYFEGDQHRTFRILRAVKNRFGSTNELGVFEMRDLGLVELENPSKILISEKPKDVAGSVIISTVEGTRPMLLEMQALVSPTSYGIPKRTSTGVDYNRVGMLLAVLEKRVGLQIQNQDVYLNIVGGIKINEPSIDLGIVIAIASSFRNIAVDETIAVTGEVGLTGEVRAVSFIEKRIAECKKLGFTKMVIPRNNYEVVKDTKGIEIWPVDNLRQAINIVLGGNK